MLLSIFLAQVMGFYLVIVGAFYLFKKDYLHQVLDDWLAHPAMSVIGAIMALIIGLLIVISHNIWVFSWVVIITIMGYLSLIKGLWRLFFPDSGKEIARKIIDANVIVGIISILLGIWLFVMGYSSSL